MSIWNPTTWFSKTPEKKRREPIFRKTAGSFEEWRPLEPFELRRFDAAKTNRLNRGHWAMAHGRSINVDLQDLAAVMARCDHEATNNPLVYGAIETLETDIVGRQGPRLQVEAEDAEHARRVEEAWQEVWDMPDPTGRLSGPETMRLWVRLIQVAGSFVNVLGNVERDGPVSFGWQTVHPRRLVTPADLAQDENTAFGIEHNNAGRPIRYHIRRRRGIPGLDDLTAANDTQAFPADMVQHRFIADEPEQVTGYPSLVPCLEVVADLREYDRLVMQATKNAAAHAVGLESASPEAIIDPEPIDTSSNYEVEPGQITIAPMGWKFSSFASTQPSAQYQDYRHERYRELGLALGMPLMMVLLSSAQSNFASAHYDGAVYLRRLRSFQSWLERRTLNQLVREVERELVIAGETRLPRSRSRFRWTWETPPYVNPEKQIKANRMAVEDGAMSMSDYSADLGKDWDEVLAARQREAEQLEEAGLPMPPTNAGTPRQSDTLRDVADSLDENEDATSDETEGAASE